MALDPRGPTGEKVEGENDGSSSKENKRGDVKLNMTKSERN